MFVLKNTSGGAAIRRTRICFLCLACFLMVDSSVKAQGSAFAAAPPVQVGQSYDGEYYAGDKVTYRIERKRQEGNPEFQLFVYDATMFFHSGDRKLQVQIRYMNNGKVTVTRPLFEYAGLDADRQWFEAVPQRVQTADGRTLWEVRGALYGFGVSQTPNEVGVLLIHEGPQGGTGDGPEPQQADLIGDEWHYANQFERGHFARSVAKEWVEYKNGRLAFRFAEVERRPNEVVLHDASRGCMVRLTATQCIVRFPNQDWRVYWERSN